MRTLTITMLETVRVCRREYVAGVHYTARDHAEKRLFEELVLNEYATVTRPEETLNGRAQTI